MNEGLATINHEVNVKVDNDSLLRIALVQLGLLLFGFALKILFDRINK